MRCQGLAAHKIRQNNMDYSLASVIEVLADRYLAEKMPATGEYNDADQCKEQVNDSIQISKGDKLNKTMTSRTRHQVLKRDQCCQYKDPVTGKICGSTFALEIDHKMSRWAGGDHAVSNLQVLCGNHNRYKYRKECQLQFL
ncbi:hypothetical protein D3C87_1671660 [compost metagenome]